MAGGFEEATISCYDADRVYVKNRKGKFLYLLIRGKCRPNICSQCFWNRSKIFPFNLCQFIECEMRLSAYNVTSLPNHTISDQDLVISNQCATDFESHLVTSQKALESSDQIRLHIASI